MNEDLAAVAEKVAAMQPIPPVFIPADKALGIALILSSSRVIGSPVTPQELGERTRIQMVAFLISLVTHACPELATLTSEYLTQAHAQNNDLPSFAEDGGFGG